MSAWTGIAVVAVALAVAVVAAGQPIWQWHLSDGTETEIWSYGLLGATHTIRNETSGAVTMQAYGYADLQNQSRMASLFQGIQRAFFALVAATIAAAGLSAATLRRKLRGLFAGIALVAGSLLAFYAAVAPVLGIAEAAGDLPRLSGQPIPQFDGQFILPRTGGASTILSWGPSMAWYLLLGLALVLAFGASEVWSLRPSKKAVRKTVPRATVTEDPPPPPPEAPPAPGHLEPVIEEVFVIGANGLLIKHMSRTLMTDKDRDVVGSMIAVVSNFVRQTFSERDAGDVQEVTLGDHRFILCNDRGVVVAVLATRGAKEDIEPRLRHLLACLVDRYGEQLDDWGGEPLEGIEDEIAILWQPFFVPPPPAD